MSHISGSRLKSFRRGWAKALGNFNCGHYFVRQGVDGHAVASCGVVEPVNVLFGIGTFRPCRKCHRKHGAPTDVRTCLDVPREQP